MIASLCPGLSSPLPELPGLFEKLLAKLQRWVKLRRNEPFDFRRNFFVLSFEALGEVDLRDDRAASTNASHEFNAFIRSSMLSNGP
jgi:hypothetical protein